MKQRSEILSNLLYIGSGDFISRALAFVTFMYLARVLGPTRLGLIGFGASAVALFAPVIDYGLGFVGTREVSRNTGTLRYYIKTILFDRLLLGLGSLVCLVAIAGLFLHDQSKIRILLLYGLTLIPGMITLTWAYQGIGRTGWFFIEKNVQAILYCGGVFAFVHLEAHVERVPLCFLVSAVLPATALLLYFLKKQNSVEREFSVRNSLAFLKSSFKLFLPTLLSQLNVSVGLLLVVYFSSLQEAGYFSAASKIAVLSVAIPNLLWSSFYSVVARSAASNVALVRPHVNSLYKYAVIIGIVPGFIGLAYGREIVMLIYDSSYAQAVVPLQLFSVVASIQCISVVLTRTLPALEMEGHFSRMLVWGMTIQVVASLILVPQYGASGAACAFVLSEGIVAVAALRLFRKTLAINMIKPSAVGLMAISSSFLVVAGFRALFPLAVVPALLVILALYFGVLSATSIISIDDFFPTRTG